MQEKSIEKFYEILELNLGASQEEVKDAYRDLAKVWHPDRFSQDPNLQIKAQEKLKLINEAYEKLRSNKYEIYGLAVEPKTEPFKKQSTPKSQTNSHQDYYQATNRSERQKYKSRTQKEPYPFTSQKNEKSRSAFSHLPLGIIIFSISTIFALKSLPSFSESFISTLSGAEKQQSGNQLFINQNSSAPNLSEINSNKSLTGKLGLISNSRAKESDSIYQKSLNRNTTNQTIENQMPDIQNSIMKGSAQELHKDTDKPPNKVVVGSTKDEVIGIYGYPSTSSKKEFHYNNLIVYFENGKVSGWKKPPQESRIILKTQQ